MMWGEMIWKVCGDWCASIKYKCDHYVESMVDGIAVRAIGQSINQSNSRST